jgi:hypothetical protein
MSENPSEVDNSYLRDLQVFLTGFLSGSLHKTNLFRDFEDEIRYAPEFPFLIASVRDGKKIKITLSVEYADDQESK